MNKKAICSIAIGLAVSTLPTFAADETADLRSQLDAVTKRLDELEKAQQAEPISSWADKVQIKGDLRYRYEYTSVNNETDENRQRIRVRLGAYAEVNDFTTAGIQIRTGGGAKSGNQTIGNNFDSKNTYFDLAYITLAPEGAKYGEVTLGKMLYPWKTTTDLIWDSDVNPEGIAYTYSTKIDDTGLFGSAGGFKVVEDGSAHDLNLTSIQAGATQPLGEKSKLTLGGSLFVYGNAADFPGYPVDYQIAEVFSEVAFADVLPVAFKLYGDLINNLEESSANHGYCFGVKFGDAKKGGWEAQLDYRDLDENAAPGAFSDSDFAGGGAGVKGTRVKAAYNIAKHLQVGVACISGEDKSTGDDVDTVLLDLIAKF